MRLAAAALLACTLLVGCQTTPQPMAARFNAGEAAFAQRNGSGAIVGQAFARQVGGGVVTAAGSPVILLPDQYYTRELASRVASGSYQSGDEAPLSGYGRSTTADASGNFRFAGLASGSYVILTEVTWGVPTQYGIASQGGSLYQVVNVQEGMISEVILTR